MEVKTSKEFFEKVLPAKFDPNKVVGLDVVVQLNITGSDGGDWMVSIKDQKLDVKQGVHPSPTITLTIADTDYVDVVNGKLGGERAFLTGKLKLKGSLAVAMKLREIGFI